MLLTYAEESLLRRLGYLKITVGLTPAQESDFRYLLTKKDKDDAAKPVAIPVASRTGGSDKAKAPVRRRRAT